jgi:hypothetical protein
LPTTLTGGSFAPGVYRGTAVTFAANSQIQFINDADLVNPVWIFNLDAAMNAGAMSTFVAPDSGTVIWNVGGALTLGAGTDFSGVALVEGAITAATSWVTCGNLYATAAVSIGSLNEAALDCSVSAQQSAGLTVSMDNIALLDGSAINSDAPACGYFGAKEMEWITTTTLGTEDKWGYSLGNSLSVGQYKWDYDNNRMMITSITVEDGRNGLKVYFYTINVPDKDYEYTYELVSKEIYDACNEVIRDALPTAEEPATSKPTPI